MWRNLWRNRVEFYPALALFVWYTVGCALNSLSVKGRPGIGSLAWITLPSVLIFFVGLFRTYRGLSSAGRQS